MPNQEHPDKELVVAFAPDSPPYAMNNATDGVEADLVRKLLADYSYSIIQMPYKELQNAIRDGKADVAVPIRAADDGVHYSDDFTDFHNAAISKKAEGIQITTVDDLKDHDVIAWQNAYNELGDTFEHLYDPATGPAREHYEEIGDQRKQVEAFWQGEDKIIVIDLNIFRHFSKEMGHAPDEVVVHAIFPSETRFQVGFKDANLRDLFNERLAALHVSGTYQDILNHYDFKSVNP